MKILQHSTKTRIQPFKYFINTSIYRHENIKAKRFNFFMTTLSSELFLNSLLQFARLCGLAVVERETCNILTCCGLHFKSYKKRIFRN